MASYPNNIFATGSYRPTTNEPLIINKHWDSVANEIPAIENELGTNPAGSFTDVKSRLDSGLITQVDLWRLTTTKDTDGDITGNLARPTEAGYGRLGTGMTQSSGVFTFPETGIYLIEFTGYGYRVVSGSDNITIVILTSTDDFSSEAFAASADLGLGGGGLVSVATATYTFDVTNTATHKVKFNSRSHADVNSDLIGGSGNYNETYFTFIRLGGT